MIRSTSAIAARSRRFLVATVTVVRSGWTNDSDVSSRSRAAMSGSIAGGDAASDPAHDASPSRWPMRRHSSNRSNVPVLPSAATSAAMASSRLRRYPSTFWLPKSACGGLRISENSSSGTLVVTIV